MSDEHQHMDTEGRPSVSVYETQSGVIFWVTPLNLPTLRAIQLKAVDVYPYPDKKLYQIPDDEEVAFVPGQVGPAEDNPEYVAKCAEADKERKAWVDRAIFDYAAHMPKYPTQAALVEAFKDRLATLRAIAKLPDDDYEAILFHLVLTWNQVAEDSDGRYVPTSTDFSRIIRLAIQTVALMPGEVSAGMRFFRPYVSGRTA